VEAHRRPHRAAQRTLARATLLALTLVLCCNSAAHAVSVRLRWTHPLTNSFNVYVSRPFEVGLDLVRHRRDNLAPDADGVYSAVVPVEDPSMTTYMFVTALDAEGHEGPASQIQSVTAAQLCGATTCDDGIQCTSDVCTIIGCEHQPRDARCEDGHPCTEDACLRHTGCVRSNNRRDCDDGLDCTVGDVCFAGQCAGSVSCAGGVDCDLTTGQCEQVPGCGDGILQSDELCDDGDTSWGWGEACRADCTLQACGDPDDSGNITALDALLILNGALGIGFCDPSVCSIDGSPGGPSSADALRALLIATGESLEIACPPFDP
jgi:hypothetical protein